MNLIWSTFSDEATGGLVIEIATLRETVLCALVFDLRPSEIQPAIGKQNRQ